MSTTTRRGFLSRGAKTVGGGLVAAVVGLNPLRRAAAQEDGFCGCSGVYDCHQCECEQPWCNLRSSAAFGGRLCSVSAGQGFTIAILDVYFPKGPGRCFACACGARILLPEGACACWVGPV